MQHLDTFNIKVFCISFVSYKQHNEKLQEIADLNDNQKDLSEYIDFGLFVLENFKMLFDSVDISIQQKLLGSILDEKLVLQNKKYRTPKFKEGFDYIYNNINKLENSSIKKGDSLSKVSSLVVAADIEPKYATHPRIGIDYAGEYWKNLPWRFLRKSSPILRECRRNDFQSFC